MKDKNGTEIMAGDTLFNPYDRDMYYVVLQGENGKLYLGDFDSPLEKYNPHIWWEIVGDEIFDGTRNDITKLGI